MGNKTAIEWCDATFNPWWGCQKVSPGCANCYAERLAVHRRHMPIWGPAAETRRKLMSDDYWKQPLKWNAAAQKAGTRARVFCASMADVFEDHPDTHVPRVKLWKLIEQTPWLDWLLLTKRPENIETMLPFAWNDPRFDSDASLPRNVWFGISAENQDTFDTRWPVLESFAYCNHPARLFLSLEPLLGPIDIAEALEEIDLGDEDGSRWTVTADWVIVGGESGPNARPMNLDWARTIHDQCVDADMPFFFKQVGGRGHDHGGDLLDGERFQMFPGDTWEDRPVLPPAIQQMRMDL